LLMRQGVESTSLDDILAYCEIKKGSFYYYFASKEQFVQTCLETCYTIPLRQVMMELGWKPFPNFDDIEYLFIHATRRLQEKMDALLGAYTLPLYSIYAELIHLSSISTYMSKSYYENNEKWINWLTDGLRHMQEQGEIAENVNCRDAARLMYHYREGVLTVWAHDGVMDIEGNIRMAMQFFKRMLQ